jgi:hypothetical protein
MLLEGNSPFGAVFVADGVEGKIRVEAAVVKAEQAAAV